MIPAAQASKIWSSPIISHSVPNSSEKPYCLSLQNISIFGWLLSFSTAATLAQATMVPHLNYCSSLLTDHSTSYSSHLSLFSTQHVTYLLETPNIFLFQAQEKPLLSCLSYHCPFNHSPLPSWPLAVLRNHQVWPCLRDFALSLLRKIFLPQNLVWLLHMHPPYLCSNIAFSVRSTQPI